MLSGWGWPAPFSEDFTGEERIFHAVFAPVCAIGSAYIFASIVAITTRVSEAARHMEHVEKINQQIKTSSGPEEMKRRICQYNTFLTVHNALAIVDTGSGGGDGGSAESFWKEHLSPDSSPMSADLQKEHKLYQFEAIISVAPFFQSVGPDDIVKVVMAFTEVAYAPGEFIIRKGDIGRELYFVMKGCCVILTDTFDELTVKGVGEYFGEVALLDDCERTAHCQSRSFSLVASLKREAFTACLENSQETKRRMTTALHSMATPNRNGLPDGFADPDEGDREEKEEREETTPLMSARSISVPQSGACCGIENKAIKECIVS